MRHIPEKAVTGIVAMLFSVLLLAILILTPSIAAADVSYAPIPGTEMSFMEYLLLNRDANMPSVKLSFTVTPGKAIAAGSTTLEVRPGTGLPRISDVSFNSEDETFTKRQPGDSITPAAGQKYARQTVSVDFRDIRFEEPGVYRYVITQHCEGLGIAEDPEPSRTLDVYIQGQGDYLAVLSYVMYEGDNVSAPAPTMEISGAVKNKSFTNTFVSRNLSFGIEVKRVVGGSARAFPLSLQISGAEAGMIYTVGLEHASPDAGPRTLTVGPDGTLKQDYRLRAGEYVTIPGLACGTAYRITASEDPDYSVSAGTKAIAIPASGKKHSENYIPGRQYRDAVSGIIGEEDVYTGYTYTQRGFARALILAAVIVAVLVLAASSVIVLTQKRRRRRRSTRR